MQDARVKVSFAEESDKNRVLRQKRPEKIVF